MLQQQGNFFRLKLYVLGNSGTVLFCCYDITLITHNFHCSTEKPLNHITHTWVEPKHTVQRNRGPTAAISLGVPPCGNNLSCKAVKFINYIIDYLLLKYKVVNWTAAEVYISSMQVGGSTYWKKVVVNVLKVPSEVLTVSNSWSFQIQAPTVW